MSEGAAIVEKVDPSFKHEVRRIPGADKLTLCFQCGMCSPDCPIARRIEAFRPRIIMRMAILGLKSALLDEGLVWLCANCYTCQEYCPQGVRPTEVIEALRSLAVREGRFHPSLKAKIEPIFEFGRMYEITEFEDEIREGYGLPPVPSVRVEELRELLRALSVTEVLGLEPGGGGHERGAGIGS